MTSTSTDHVWTPQGFCVYCHNVHRTDMRPNNKCSFLSRFPPIELSQTREEWKQEILGMPTPSTPQDSRLRELAAEYHTRCDAFDETCCTHRRKGVAWPANGEQMSRVGANARRVRDEITATAGREGIPASDVRNAIRDHERQHR